MSESQIREMISFHATKITEYLEDLENCTGKRYALTLDDGETYSGFSGCTIDEIQNIGTPNEGLGNPDLPSLAGF